MVHANLTDETRALYDRIRSYEIPEHPPTQLVVPSEGTNSRAGAGIGIAHPRPAARRRRRDSLKRSPTAYGLVLREPTEDFGPLLSRYIFTLTWLQEGSPAFGRRKVLVMRVHTAVVAAALAAATIGFAAPAAAEPASDGPCGDGLSSIAYALDVASGEMPTAPPWKSSPEVPCACGGSTDSPCMCEVFCLCRDPANYEGNFAYCMSDLMHGMCPGEPF